MEELNEREKKRDAKQNAKTKKMLKKLLLNQDQKKTLNVNAA